MSEDIESEADVLKRDARRWVQQLISGNATTADAEALLRWRQISPAHDAAYAEAAHLWRTLGPGGRIFVARHGAPTWSGPKADMGRRAMLIGSGALAASVAAYAVLKPPLDLWPSFDELRADYRTATGEQRRIDVADVTVRLNTQTSLSIAPEAGAAPHIRLISGQASFDMPAEPSRRLIVLAGDGQMSAERARFDVRRLVSRTCVTCVEGTIEVSVAGRSDSVGSGQQVIYDEDGLGPVTAVDTREVTSWQDGFVVFRATPLLDAIAEINRYRSGRVMVLNAALGQKTISGRFRTERTDEILVWIEKATGAKSRALPGGIILLS